MTVEGRSADAVRSNLEQLILSGAFSDGDRLNETRLAEKLGVSRTPLREALQSLAANGLVELVPNRGAFVRHPSTTEMVEMFEVMAELEAMCARLAARRATENQLLRLEETDAACVEAAKAGDSDAYYWKNETFHMALYAASGNGYLAEEAARLHRRLQPFRRLQLRTRGRMAQSLEEHRSMVLAIRAGQGEQAAAVAWAHVAVQGDKFNDLIASLDTSRA